MIYIDTSALLKLVFAEDGTDELKERVSGDATLVSSALILVEARRGVARRAPRRMPRIDLLLNEVTTIEMASAVIEKAGRLPDPMLRSLDAIHLATALQIRDDLDVVLTYDVRLADAAAAHGLTTASPGASR